MLAVGWVGGGEGDGWGVGRVDHSMTISDTSPHSESAGANPRSTIHIHNKHTQHTYTINTHNKHTQHTYTINIHNKHTQYTYINIHNKHTQ